MINKISVACPYCGKKVERINGSKLYPNIPKLHSKKYYRCDDCDAHVGCHVITGKPLGTPAKAELRVLRSKVHRNFDSLWQNGKLTRRQAYQNLARILKIDLSECHIGMFNEERCMEALKLLNRL